MSGRPSPRVRRTRPRRRERRYLPITDTINDGTAPIHEDGLSELIATHAGPNGTGRLTATTDYEAVLDTDVKSECR